MRSGLAAPRKERASSFRRSPSSRTLGRTRLFRLRVDDPIWGSDPHPQRAWGYTDMVHDFIVMHPLLCAGAAAITDTKLPAWQRATGALVLVHEAYHVRLWKSRWSEARVECQAIRHFEEGAKLLGASVEIANDLLPYALAAHQRMVRIYPSYRQPRCRLPLWAVPMTP